MAVALNIHTDNLASQDTQENIHTDNLIYQDVVHSITLSSQQDNTHTMKGVVTLHFSL